MTEYVRGNVSGKPPALEDHANPDWLLFSELLLSTKLIIIITSVRARSEARTLCHMKFQVKILLQ